MSYQFINPYNFIPLGDECNRQKNNEEKKYTGYIECELKTLTPMIIIDHEKCKEDENGHKIYKDTFMINKVPAIPASELRGMIRSKFEILTNSCLSSAEEELPFYGRYNGNMRKPGILDFSDPKNVKLYSCTKYEVEQKDRGMFNKYQTGDFVTFNSRRKKRNVEVFNNFNNNGYHSGYVKKGELFNRKNAVHIFEIKNEIQGLVNQKDFAEMYKEICETYEEGFENKGVKKKHNSQTEKAYRPVWYEIIDNYVYFSLGQNGQTKYRRRLKNLMNHSFLPCKDSENLCEACELFGTVQNNLAVSSKVRFEDAYLKDKIDEPYITHKPIVLEELSSPKYNNALFYMFLYEDYIIDYNTNLSWNVDFKSKFNMKQNKTFAIGDNEIEIRGRKQYWHHKPNINKKVEKTKRNVSVRPIKDNLTYTFKVYFDNISETQLEHLHMAITLGENNDYAHKLGLGKPLGYGSVKIKATNIVYKNVNLENNKIKYQMNKYIPKCKTIQNTFKTLTESQRYAIDNMFSYSFLLNHHIIVDYPKNNPNDNGFEWFQANKSNRNKLVLPFSSSSYDKLIQRNITKSRSK